MTNGRAVLWLALASGLALHAYGQADMTELRATQPLMEGWKFVLDDNLTEADALESTVVCRTSSAETIFRG